MTVTTATPILEARGLRRSFGAVRALDGTDFDAYAGGFDALIGDNGAGTSTMVKALSGNLALDSGAMFDGNEVDLDSGRQHGNRDGLPGSRTGLAPQPGPEHLSRARDPRVGSVPGSRTPRPCGSDRRRHSRISAATVRSYGDPWAAWQVASDRRSPSPPSSLEPRCGPARRAHRGARVSDRVPVLRLICRVATYDTNDTTVGRLIGAINVHQERPMTPLAMCESTSNSHVLEFRR